MIDAVVDDPSLLEKPLVAQGVALHVSLFERLENTDPPTKPFAATAAASVLFMVTTASKIVTSARVSFSVILFTVKSLPERLIGLCDVDYPN